MADRPAQSPDAPPTGGLRKRTQAPPSDPATNAPGATPSRPEPDADIRPQKPPVRLRAGWVAWLLPLVSAAVLVLAWLAWRRYRLQRQRPPPVPVIPPYRRALERLRAALDRIHEPERFTVAVSAALREYLEERFGLHAPERTTEEFLAELQTGQVLTPLQQQLMADFLTRCDLVKFARYEPRETELRELYDAAVRLVEETEPLLRPVTPAAPAAPNPAATAT